jgi:flagellar protein FliO/FliZ
MSNAPEPQAPSPRATPKLLAGGVLVVILGFGLPALFGGAGAAPNAPTKPAKLAPEPIAPPSAGSIGLSLFKLVVGLAVMCGVCVLMAKYVAPKPAPAAHGLNVVAALPVGACTVHLVRAGDRRLLVGTDASGVKAVLELPPGPEPAAPPEAQPAAQEPAPAEAESPPSQAEIIQLLLKLRDRTSSPG